MNIICRCTYIRSVLLTLNNNMKIAPSFDIFTILKSVTHCYLSSVFCGKIRFIQTNSFNSILFNL